MKYYHFFSSLVLVILLLFVGVAAARPFRLVPAPAVRNGSFGLHEVESIRNNEIPRGTVVIFHSQLGWFAAALQRFGFYDSVNRWFETVRLALADSARVVAVGYNNDFSHVIIALEVRTGRPRAVQRRKLNAGSAWAAQQSSSL